MFNKKSCRNCSEKISNKFDFCPHCGKPTGKKREDWGMLGKNDLIEEENQSDPFAGSMFGGISGKMLSKMLGSAMKMLENEMRKGMDQPKEMPLKTNFELYVNGKKISPENIKVVKKPSSQKQVKKVSHKNNLSQESLQKFTNLPKEEPTTNIRRLSNKVVYEINIPGVESIDDIVIVKLESSIEIKALGKNKAYKKIIPVDLPLKRYRLEDEKLILELGAE